MINNARNNLFKICRYIWPLLLPIFISEWAHSNDTTVSSSVNAASLSMDQLKVAYTTSNHLCIYRIKKSKIDTKNSNHCTTMVNEIHKITFSPNDKILLMISLKGASIFYIDTQTSKKIPLFEIENTPQLKRIELAKWLDNEHILFGFPCGYECIRLYLYDIIHDSISKPKGVSIITGSLLKNISGSHFYYEGHAGELVLLKPIRDASFEQVTIKPGCLDADYWYNIEDQFGEQELLLSKHSCEKQSAIYTNKAELIYLNLQNNHEKVIFQGAPASLYRPGNNLAINSSYDELSLAHLDHNTDKNVHPECVISVTISSSEVLSGFRNRKPIWDGAGEYVAILQNDSDSGKKQERLNIYDARKCALVKTIQVSSPVGIYPLANGYLLLSNEQLQLTP